METDAHAWTGIVAVCVFVVLHHITIHSQRGLTALTGSALTLRVSKAFIQFNALISAIGPGFRDPAYSHLVKEAKHVRDLLRRLATPCPGDSRTYRTTVRNSVNMVALLLHANLSADYIILNSLLDGSPWGRPAAGGVRT